jgi:hypothetical protein
MNRKNRRRVDDEVARRKTLEVELALSLQRKRASEAETAESGDTVDVSTSMSQAPRGLVYDEVRDRFFKSNSTLRSASSSSSSSVDNSAYNPLSVFGAPRHENWLSAILHREVTSGGPFVSRPILSILSQVHFLWFTYVIFHVLNHFLLIYICTLHWNHTWWPF